MKPRLTRAGAHAQALPGLLVPGQPAGPDTGVSGSRLLGRLVCNSGLPPAHAPHGPYAGRGTGGVVRGAAEPGVQLTAAGHQLAQGAAQCMGSPRAASPVSL